MTESVAEKRDLLPSFLRNPWSLLATLLAPQVVLLLLNLRAWWLVAGEMTPVQAADASALGGAGVALCLAGLVAALAMGRRGATMDLRHGSVLVLAHIAYLWAFTAWFHRIIPAGVPDWMLPRGQVMYHQYALIMPALLHGALLVAGFRSRRSAGLEVGVSLGLLVGIPAVAYVLVRLMDTVWRHGSHRLTSTIVLLFFASLTTVLLVTLLRLLTLLADLMRRWGGHGRLVLVALVGLVGPVAGLLLNVRIPFPVDFQSAAVYLLAVLNGLVLLSPVTGARTGHRAAWLLQCALFGFTAYFMLVFLPFLPLALLAIIAAGAGLLLLVPLVLFVVHAQQLAAGWRAAARGWRIAGALALFTLPAMVAGRAHFDRYTLNAALAHVYSPDYRTGELSVNRAALKRGLENLRDFKAGLQLPFIGDYYNHVVFGGLVLPDEKLKALHLTFFGTELPAADKSGVGMNLFGASRRTEFRQWRSAPPSTNDVRLVSLDTARAEEDDCETATAKLVLHNDSKEQREFVTRLHVPPGVFITGYWLHIGAERVPGRIFEKKAALWVYEMIRDLTRRDPGLLLFKDPTTVELRVFPLAGGETRTTEIELMWPRGLNPPIRIADRAIDTASAARVPGPLVVAGEQGRLMIAAPAALRAASAAEDPEPPYLHIVLDTSEGSKPGELAARARAAADRVPGVRDVMVSAANYEFQNVTPEPVPLERLEEVVRGAQPSVRGGFCRDRALKHVLAWRADHAPGRGVVPAVVLGDGPRAVLPDEDLPYFAAWHPDVPAYLEAAAGGPVQAYDFQRRPVDNAIAVATRVAVGDRAARIPLNGDSPVCGWLPPGQGGAASVTNPRYLAAAVAWVRYAGWLQNPAGRDEERGRIVEASRAANVLTPLSAFIVVENSAQWRMLEQKEKQKLKESDVLEIQKAPEPATWLLAAGVGAWLLWRRTKRAEASQLGG